MIESKLKAKNCKLSTAVSTWLGLVSIVYATQNRTTSRKDGELSMKLVVMAIRMGSNSNPGCQLDTATRSA